MIILIEESVVVVVLSLGVGCVLGGFWLGEGGEGRGWI